MKLLKSSLFIMALSCMHPASARPMQTKGIKANAAPAAGALPDNSGRAFRANVSTVSARPKGIGAGVARAGGAQSRGQVRPPPTGGGVAQPEKFRRSAGRARSRDRAARRISAGPLP